MAQLYNGQTYATKDQFLNSQGSGSGLLGGGNKTAKANTLPKSTASFYGTPQTVFPQYTSGSWANLPTGVLGSPPPQAPTTPAPTTPQNPALGLLGGLFGSQFNQLPGLLLLQKLLGGGN